MSFELLFRSQIECSIQNARKSGCSDGRNYRTTEIASDVLEQLCLLALVAWDHGVRPDMVTYHGNKNMDVNDMENWK
jgi:hypothetical protein